MAATGILKEGLEESHVARVAALEEELSDTSAILVQAAHTLHELNSSLTAVQLFLAATAESPEKLREELPAINASVDQACLLGTKLGIAVNGALSRRKR